MKKIIAIITVLIGLISYGQEIDVNLEIEKDFNDYYKLIAERKIDNALEYSNPKLFEIIPREQMKNLMEAVYKTSNIEFKTGMPTFLKFDEIMKIDNVNYVKFNIISPIEMKFDEIESNGEKALQMMKNFEMKFGVGSVHFDKESGFYKINAEKTIIASNNNNLLDWKFVTVDDEKMKLLLEKIIPSELLN